MLLVRAATGNGFEGEKSPKTSGPCKVFPRFFSTLGMTRVELRRRSSQKTLKPSMLPGRPKVSGFANPRNAATGGLRTKRSHGTKRRGHRSFIFQAAYTTDADSNNMFWSLIPIWQHQPTQRLDLKFHMKKKKVRSIDEVIRFCLAWQEKEMTTNINRWHGGQVNDYALPGRVWLHRPPPQMEPLPLNLKAKQATSKLWRCRIPGGKNWQHCPVAKIQPVALAGSR